MQGSAEIGAAAQWWLAQLYLRGQGLLQDCEVATKWLQRAADQGEAFAQWDLGKLYRDGKGVPQDDIVAHMWLNLTAAHIPRLLHFWGQGGESRRP